jgi:hypothetical protein
LKFTKVVFIILFDGDNDNNDYDDDDDDNDDDDDEKLKLKVNNYYNKMREIEKIKL